MRKLHLLLLLLVFTVSNVAKSQVVISQVYGGGGNSGATYTHDFIELFNRGTSSANLAGWSVQYASAAGTTWAKTDLTSVTLAPGQYYLVREAQGTGGTTPLPTPDAIGTIAMSATAGKVALVNNTTLLAGSGCPFGASTIDFIGYGTANCFEGSLAAPGLSNTTADLRAANGCTDNNTNNTDFAAGAPNPRNTANPFNPCSLPNSLTINDISLNEGNAGTTNFIFTVSLSSAAGTGGVTFDIATQNNSAIAPGDYTANSLTGQTIPAGSSSYSFTVLVNGDVTAEPNETFFVNVTNVVGVAVTDGQGTGTILNDDCAPTTTIAQIQGTGNSSPVLGASVTVSGIVTGRKSNGFFIQSPDAETDADPNTSEGIFVFTSSAPPATVIIGNSVCVTGTVGEFIPSSDPNSPSQTEITLPTSIIALSTGNPLPGPVVLVAGDTNPTGTIYQLEKYEGMRVQVNSMTVVAPTQGNITESSATATSTGYFYGVITGISRPFREPGIQLPDALPVGAPATVTRWDANPELIGVASLGQTGSAAINVASGAMLTNLVGPLDFIRRYYTINPDAAAPPSVSNNGLTFTAVPVPANDELTVASFNIQRFFDNVNDPAIGEPVLTATAYNNRLNKVSLAIRNVLRFPDIIGVIEVENLTVLQTIAAKVNDDAIAAAQPNPNYQAYLIEGNDVGGIDVGFLVKSPRVSVVDVTQEGKTTTYINPNNNLPEILNDRPPLVLRAGFNKPGCETAYPVTVIVNHLRSLNGVDDPVDGNRVRTKRRAQAEFLANLIQTRQTADPSENIISLGDFNAFQFNDGFVDLIGTIKGTPTPAANVVLASADLVTSNLTDLIDSHSPAQRYSYSFMGSAQVLDHILVNQSILDNVSQFSIARLDADFPETVKNDATRPERISDHDVAVAYFLFEDETPPAAVCQPATITLVNGSASITAADVDGGSSDECSEVTLSVSPSQFNCTNIGANNVILTVTDAAGNSSTCVAVVTVVGVVPSCTITAIPANNIYTGGIPTNIYLGYGPQSVTLSINAIGGAPFTYSWSGSGGLSCTDCNFPTFTPTSEGVYTFTVTVTNSYGCTTTCSITICVLDIRVPGTNGKKVYLCHAPPDNPSNTHTLAVSVNAVNEHMTSHPGDRLGQCGQDPCSLPVMIVSRSNKEVQQSGEMPLMVSVLPNPSASYFTLLIEGKNDLPATLRITDMYGRLIIQHAGISANSYINIGNELMAGLYFAEVKQGLEQRVVKLIKLQH